MNALVGSAGDFFSHSLFFQKLFQNNKTNASLFCTNCLWKNHELFIHFNILINALVKHKNSVFDINFKSFFPSENDLLSSSL